MSPETKKAIKKVFFPLYWIYRSQQVAYAKKHPMRLADKTYYKKLGKHIDWNNPKDINEKIQWLKFHTDQRKWAFFADKYAVRNYIKEKGLENLLTKIYGKWDSPEEVIDAWDSLPDEFVLKCNTGSNLMLIVSKEKGGKKAVDKRMLYKTLKKWFKEKDTYIINTEFHYQFIHNCVFAEELIKDNSIKDFSRSLIDYTIWCFNGVPYGCFLCYDRIINTSHHYFDFYDLQWNERTDLMADKSKKHYVPKPENWELMLKYASILSQGFPQARVDFYNLNGKIIFGEITLTSFGGFITYYSDELLLALGNEVKLDLSAPPNEFYEHIK